MEEGQARIYIFLKKLSKWKKIILRTGKRKEMSSHMNESQFRTKTKLIWHQNKRNVALFYIKWNQVTNYEKFWKKKTSFTCLGVIKLSFLSLSFFLATSSDLRCGCRGIVTQCYGSSVISWCFQGIPVDRFKIPVRQAATSHCLTLITNPLHSLYDCPFKQTLKHNIIFSSIPA